jgi:transposase InsO family protein
MESFFRTLKQEEIYLSEYRTLADVPSMFFYFIEEVYNLKRLHSTLGCCPRKEFEELLE